MDSTKPNFIDIQSVVLEIRRLNQDTDKWCIQYVLFQKHLRNMSFMFLL